MDFSLFYFDGDGSGDQPQKYRLLIESAKFADRNGFKAIWTPERHFYAFGGLYPNPALTSAALAMITEQIRLRAGSAVIPLHDPVRFTEDWSVVDNLSNGRSEIAFAPGWTVDDFVLSREPHSNRKMLMWQNIELVQKLWRGESIDRQDATGKTFTVKTLPKPLQAQLPIWMTAQAAETFIEAGKIGANVLTSLLGGTLEDVTSKIKLYRNALAKYGHDPRSRKVALMIHTFVGEDLEAVKNQVRQPFCHYLKTHYDLLEGLAKGMGLTVSMKDFSEDDIDSLLEFGVEGFMKGRSLIGTPASCQPFVEQMRQGGIDEIACLIDFVQDRDLILASLPYLNQLRQLCIQNYAVQNV
jgi:natural product biosynthesis luciferase-like monooxygenase protein